MRNRETGEVSSAAFLERSASILKSYYFAVAFADFGSRAKRHQVGRVAPATNAERIPPPFLLTVRYPDRNLSVAER